MKQNPPFLQLVDEHNAQTFRTSKEAFGHQFHPQKQSRKWIKAAGITALAVVALAIWMGLS